MDRSVLIIPLSSLECSIHTLVLNLWGRHGVVSGVGMDVAVWEWGNRPIVGLPANVQSTIPEPNRKIAVSNRSSWRMWGMWGWGWSWGDIEVEMEVLQFAIDRHLSNVSVIPGFPRCIDLRLIAGLTLR
jgi:hypothetical protein